MSLEKDLKELVSASVIPQETADVIQHYYKTKPAKTSNLVVILFAILGVFFIGSGINLIIASNWDELPILVKTIIGFMPLLIAQCLSLYAIILKSEQKAWTESTAVFQFIMVGVTISIVAQIYNLSGDFSQFILVWALLGLPLVYFLRSSMASFIYLFYIAWFAALAKFDRSGSLSHYYYWPLLLLVVPHYILLIKKNMESILTVFHHWLISASFALAVFISIDISEFSMLPIVSLLGLFYLIGQTSLFNEKSLFRNPYKLFGSIGTVIILFMGSYSEFWRQMGRIDYLTQYSFGYTSFWFTLVFTSSAIGLLFLQNRSKKWTEINPVSGIFLVVMFLLTFSHYLPETYIYFNVLLIILGVFSIRIGVKQKHLGIINYGLLILMVLLALRFIDVDLSFELRGLAFLIVGFGFLMTNYWVVKRRKSHVE